MDISGIAAASVSMSTSKLQQEVGIAVMGRVMDIAKQQNGQLLDMMAGAPHPYLGKSLDIRA